MLPFGGNCFYFTGAVNIIKSSTAFFSSLKDIDKEIKHFTSHMFFVVVGTKWAHMGML